MLVPCAGETCSARPLSAIVDGMADLQDELIALRAQIAALTARLYRVEQRLDLDSETPRETPGVVRASQPSYPLVAPSPPAARPDAPIPISPLPVPSFSAATEKEEEELEGQIGK